ncbi:MAG: hypothetical protein V1725_06610 [archaeon]
MVLNRDTVFEVVLRKGPVIPIDIIKELGGNTILVGAMLSELASASKVLITNTKKGGSPFYYVPQQMHLLDKLAVHLNEKDRRAFDVLKEKKVVKDADLDPLFRVCMRAIKDFATPHPVGEELYWKYYLLSDADAKQILDAQQPVTTSPEVPVPPQAPPQTTEPVLARQERPVQEKILPHQYPHQQHVQQPVPSPTHVAPAVELQQTLKKKEKPQHKPTPLESFHERTLRFFSSKNVEVIDAKKLGKTEFEYRINVPSPIGKTLYYCKAKDKRRINEGDLAVAAMLGQNMSLPVLVLTTGELTKKAKELLPTFKNLTLANL